jgi:hypothetical protein
MGVEVSRLDIHRGRPLRAAHSQFANREQGAKVSLYSQHATLSDVVAEYESLRARYDSAVRTLQDIADWRRDPNCLCDACELADAAASRLIQLGEPIEPQP